MNSKLESLAVEHSFDHLVEDAFGLLLALSDISAEEAALAPPEPEQKKPVPEAPFTELPFGDSSEFEIEEPDFNDFDWQTYFGPGRAVPIVHYCTTRDQTEADLQVIDVEPTTVVGLDCEWAANDKRSFNTLPHTGEFATAESRMKRITDCLSVILLSCEVNAGYHIYIIHLSRFPSNGDGVDQLIAPTLRKILESPDILKVGISVKGDGDKIEQWLGIKVQSLRCTLQMQRILNGEPESIKCYKGMQGMTKAHLGLSVKDKNRFGQTSAWNVVGDLLPRQYQYACNDAILPLLLDAALFQELLDHAHAPSQDVPVENSEYTPPKPRVIDLTRENQLLALDKDNPDYLVLYNKLIAFRDNVLIAQGLDPHEAENIQYTVANSKSILRLAQYRPSTLEEMRAVKGLGTKTKTEYFYGFLNTVQAHLGVELDVEPVGWKDQLDVEKKARRAFEETFAREGFETLLVDEAVWRGIWRV